MAQDYKTRLTADTSQHDNALKRSAQQVYQYKAQTEGAKKTLTSIIGKFGKFTGAIGLSVTALGSLKKGFELNQKWADAYGTAMQTAKTVSEQFILSVTKADFSNFIGGLVTATKNAKELYNAMDALNTQKILSIGNLAKLNYELTQAKLDVRNGVEGAAERVRAAEQAIEAELSKQLPLLEEQLYAKVKEVLNYDDLRRPKLDIDFVLQWAEQGDDAIEKRIQNLKNEMAFLDHQNHPEGGVTNAMRYGEWEQEHRKMRHEVELLEKIKGNLTDGDQLKEIQETIAAYWNLKTSIAQTKLGDVKYTKGLDDPDPEPKPIKLTATFEKGSIAEVEKQIADLQARFKNENLNGSERRAITEQIEVLKVKKQALEDMGKPMEHLKALQQPLEEPVILELDNQQFLDGLQEVIDGIKEVGVTIDDLEKLEKVGDGIGYIGDMFSNLSDIMGDESGKVFAAIGNSIGVIGEAIAKISALMMAKGAASVMDLPFPENLAALASVIAAVTAVISSIQSTSSQSFADGGIFSGKTTIGDYNLARVNSGEMILNNRQQQHLFNLLNGGTQAHDNSNGGNVTFTIHGSDLQGTLNNYNRKTGRVR